MDRNKNYYRALCHRKRNIIWKRITSKTPYNILIIDESDIKQEVIDKEIMYIALMGKKSNKTGILSNLTDGGEGLKGHRIEWTKSMRKVASLTAKNRKITEVTREKLRNNMINRSIFGKSNRSKSIIKVDNITKKVIKEYRSCSEAARQHNTQHQHISKAALTDTLFLGYNWIYTDGN